MAISRRGADPRESDANKRRSATKRGFAGHQAAPFALKMM
jgi:hypothetical protein